MPITLRARPTCHYCGKRNSPSNNQRKFTCQHCQADNYLDESGQIADVPASAATTPQQYAIPKTPAFENPEGSIFCSTCLKNQYMYNTALAEYLPDPDHPEYDQFEAAIPAFKKDLERRFPTCCAICEPKVKAQLQQATYNARSDHLRRVLDRSRQRRNASRWGWRSLMVNAAGLGWLVSLFAQLSWHAMGSQSSTGVVALNLRPTQCLTTWPVPAQCPAMLEPFIGPSLLLGIVCMWWNPKWQHKLEGREGRLVGLDSFYKVQGVVLALRFVAWTVIKDVPDLARFDPMIHTISLILIAMIVGWCRFGIITVYRPQIVDWSQDSAPLLDSRQYVPPASIEQMSPPNSQQPIPVSIFSTSATPGPQPWRPPTPPVDEDAMEWDPTPTTFSPNLKTIKYKSSEPTPFQGTLPAFPRGNIYNSKQETLVEQPKAIGLPRGFFDKSHGKPLRESTTPMSTNTGLAQPRFFPDMGRADTGLENIFDTVFSLRDEAQIMNTDSNTRRANAGSSIATGVSGHRLSAVRPSVQVVRVYRAIAAIVLGLSVALFSVQCCFDLPVPQFASTEALLHILMAVPLLDLSVQALSGQMHSSAKFDFSTIAASLIESSGLFFLWTKQPDEQSVLLPLWQKLVIGSMTLLLVQEVYFACVEEATSAQLPNYVRFEENKRESPPPPLTLVPQPTPSMTKPQTLRRSSSDESLASTASIATTSTASGWKTPVKTHREELHVTPGPTSYGFSGLSLKDDHGFGSSNSVAAPRTRRAPARSDQRGW